MNNKYRIERNNWNSYLVMFVEQGEMHVKVENEVYKLFSGDLILLNCYEPHLYYAQKTVHLNEAKTLLLSTDLSLSEISTKCGYNSDSYFITIFKKI